MQSRNLGCSFRDSIEDVRMQTCLLSAVARYRDLGRGRKNEAEL